jgi:hypothetical protein
MVTVIADAKFPEFSEVRAFLHTRFLAMNATELRGALKTIKTSLALGGLVLLFEMVKTK